MKKTILSMLIVIAMLFCLFVAPASADTSGTCGANLTWTLDSAGTLTISGTGAMYGYNYNTMPWYSVRDNINTITIADGITSIGKYAFGISHNLTSITIPNTVTSIGEYAFSNCINLKGITIPNSVTSIGSHAFSTCYNLKSITIPNSVTSIGSHAFYECSNLASITIPSGVTSIGIATFYECVNLASIAIPSSVTSIGDSAFYCCRSLTSVTIPNTVTSIGEYAFSGCLSLKSITIPSGVTSIGSYAFTECISLTNINVDANNTEYSSQNGVLFNKYKTTLIWCPDRKTETYNIPNTVTSIEERAFSNCINLKSITIPNSLTSIGDNAFSYCTGLTSITIPNSVTSIGSGAFSTCTGLTSITIPNSVTSIGNGSFSSCNNLIDVTIGNSVTSIGNRAFYGCRNLTNITIPNSVASIGDNAFEGSWPANVIYLGSPTQWDGITNGIFRFTNITFQDGAKLVTVIPAQNGTVIASKDYAQAGETITISATPNSEYMVKSIKVNGNTITPINDVYSFVMPNEAVTITAEFDVSTSLAITDSVCTDDSIKFISHVNINSNDTVDTFGTVFIPLHLFNTSASMAKVEYSASENPIKSGDTFGATLNNIPDGYSDVFFVGKSYIKLDDNTVIWSKAKKVSIDEPTLRKVAE